MPKLTRSLPKYRKHKASGQAIVTIAGKDHYLGPHGTQASKQEYDRLVAEWLSMGRKAPVQDSGQQVTLVEILAAYWRFAEGYYVKNGKPTNELDAMRLVIRDAKELYGRTLAAEFGPKALKAVRQKWIEKGQARPTINKNQRRLTRIFRWAAAEELIPGTVVHNLSAVPGLKKGRCDSPEPAPIKPVPIEVVERTLPCLPRVTQDMIRFQLLTGARPGEVCKLRPMDVKREGDVWEYHVEGHKTEHHGRSRVVYIGPEAQAILRPYLLREADKVCFSMSESLEERRQAAADSRVTPPSCGNRRGYRSNYDRHEGKAKRSFQEAFDAGTYRKAIGYACDEAFDAPAPLGRQEGESHKARMRRLTKAERLELKEWQKQNRWHPNQLRHTRATEIRAKFGLEAAQVILGHAAADVTQVYAERDAEKAREVARKIG